MHDLSFPFTIKKHPRARRIKVIVTHRGQVRVTTPRRVSDKDILHFLQLSQSWIESQLKRVEEQRKALPHVVGSHRYEQFKSRAKQRILARVRAVNQHYQFTYQKVTIKNTSTRWGSCSSKGNLNFAYQLYFLPEPLIDYVVAHELCHLKEMNHSVRFWRLVAETVPDYKKRKQELKLYQML